MTPRVSPPKNGKMMAGMRPTKNERKDQVEKTRNRRMIRTRSVTIQGIRSRCLWRMAPRSSSRDKERWSTTAVMTPYRTE